MSFWNIDTRSGATKAWIAVYLLQAFALLTINARCADLYYDSLMFTSPRLNILAIAVMFLLPVLSNFLLWRSISPERSQPPLPRKAALWGAIALMPISALCLLAFPCTLLGNVNIIVNNQPVESVLCQHPSFVRSVPIDGPPVRIYAYSGSGPLWLQQERPVLPGLLWVTQLYKEDNANRVTVQIIDQHHLRCTFPPTEYRQSPDTVVVENP